MAACRVVVCRWTRLAQTRLDLRKGVALRPELLGCYAWRKGARWPIAPAPGAVFRNVVIK